MLTINKIYKNHLSKLLHNAPDIHRNIMWESELKYSMNLQENCHYLKQNYHKK